MPPFSRKAKEMTRNRHKNKEHSIAAVIENNTPTEHKHFVLNNGSPAVIQSQIKIRRFPICWAIPLDELCFSLWFSNFMHLPIMPWDNISITMSTYLPEARNHLHQVFVEDMKDVEYLFMLDSDVMPPPTIIERLLAHKKPMVGGWYRKKGGENEIVVYNSNSLNSDGTTGWHSVEQAGKGLEKVKAAGAGCWLMKREVAEAIGSRPYNMERGGEDLELCMKVAEAGYDIYIDWDMACAHAGVGVT
jgi:cellulose synthase/poly-beta-1,6-N-acetylglucosamine synthase-like glycosyltransferase